MLRATVTELRAAADGLDEAGTRLLAVDPGPSAFGAGGLGLLGEAGREAFGRWSEALDARVREARSHAERIREFADLVDRAAGGFTDAAGSAAAVHRDEERTLGAGTDGNL